MIEQYTLYDIGNLTDRFGLASGVPKGVKPRYNISPTQSGVVVVASNDTTELVSMQWGLVPKDAKSNNSVFRYKTFNAASEKVFIKPSWNTAIRHQRCIIPANGFYMWRSQPGSKDAYYFSDEAKELLAFGGIYSTWIDPAGKQQQTYAMLTIEANETMPLPFRRMPVILHRADETNWLDASVDDFSSLVRAMRPYEGSALSYSLVSSEVASTKVDNARLIQPLH